MGKNLVSIYIFQRIPMMLLIQIDFMKNNTYLYFVLCMIITFVLAFVYNKTIMLKNRLVNSNNVQDLHLTHFIICDKILLGNYITLCNIDIYK